MRIAADTNLLVRALMDDHPEQSPRAQAELAQASVVAIATPALCELVWVLTRGYGIDKAEIAQAVRRLIDSSNVVTHRPPVEAGLTLLEAGGDFADAAIAAEGRALGGETFVSFDRQAIALVGAQGGSARLPA